MTSARRPLDTLEAIRRRRSIGRLVEPAPTEADLRAILTAGASAPDHGELRPFRFTVVQGQAMDELGEVLEEAYRARCAESGDEVVAAKAEKERTKLRRAPLVVVVGAVHQASATIPWVEQLAAAAAAAENILLAATALGYGSMWRTGDPSYDDRVKAALGLRPEDAVVGFLYLGSIAPDSRVVKPPHDPDLTGLVHEWPSPMRDETGAP